MVVAEKAREEAEERVHQLEMVNKEAMKKVEEEAKAREALASMAKTSIHGNIFLEKYCEVSLGNG